MPSSAHTAHKASLHPSRKLTHRRVEVEAVVGSNRAVRHSLPDPGAVRSRRSEAAADIPDSLLSDEANARQLQQLTP